MRLMLAGTLATLGATAGLSHAFVTVGWVPRVAFAVVVAFGAGWLGRRLGLPGAAAFLGSLFVLFLFTSAVFFPGTTVLGLPTAETFRTLGDTFGQAGTQIREEVAPVEVTRPLMVLACAGAYLVAVLVDVMVFRWRRPAAAGLPLLALYVVPSSLAKEGGEWLPFAIAGAGYLALLIAEGHDRTRRWGRRLVGAGPHPEIVNLASMSRTGAWLGAGAVGLAILVPLFVPDPGAGVLGSGGPGFGNGPSSVSVVNPIVNLRPQLRSPDNTELLVVRTETDRPPYLRLTSLDAFDGTNWTQSALNAPARQRVAKKTLPDPPGLEGAPADRVALNVEVRNLDVRWLPAPYAPVKVNAKGDWRYDADSRTVFSARAKTQRLTYDVESLLAHPDMAFLAASNPVGVPGMQRYVQLPASRSQLAQALLNRLMEGAASPYEVVLRIQDYLRGPDFRYSLRVPAGTSESALDRFLTVRTGYCEQFAATMAYLVRLAGIPARVAIGFTPGTLVAGGTWSVTNKDAHAWPEVYFPGAGWLPFEPTPRPDGLDTPDYAPLASGTTGPGEVAPTEEPVPSSSPSPTTTSAPQRPLDPGDPTTATNAESGGGGGRGRLVVLATAALLLLAGTPATARQLIRRRRRARGSGAAARAHAAWRNLADDAEDLGFPMRASDSPRMAARRLRQAAHLAEPGAVAVDRLAMAEERARYSPTTPDVSTLDREQRTARRALLHTRGRRRRLRARLLPPSVLRRTRAAIRRRAGGVLDWAEDVRRALRRRAARS